MPEVTHTQFWHQKCPQTITKCLVPAKPLQSEHSSSSHCFTKDSVFTGLTVPDAGPQQPGVAGKGAAAVRATLRGPREQSLREVGTEPLLGRRKKEWQNRSSRSKHTQRSQSFREANLFHHSAQRATPLSHGRRLLLWKGHFQGRLRMGKHQPCRPSPHHCLPSCSG